jgi:hypothetical protein
MKSKRAGQMVAHLTGALPIASAEVHPAGAVT